MSRAAEPDFGAPQPWWSRPGFVAAAVLLALVMLVGVVVAVLPDRDQDGQLNAPASRSPIVSTSTPSSSSTPPPTQVVPTAAPAGVRWELTGQQAVPGSDVDGPRRRDGKTAAGFSHTPTGALIAAAQIAIRSAHIAGRESWEPTITRQFVPSADRERLLVALRQAPPEQPEPGELAPIAGYIYQSYSPDTAVIGIVSRAPGGGQPRYQVLTVTLLWRDGDWRMQAPPGGSWLSLSRQASDLTGVVEWGAR